MFPYPEGEQCSSTQTQRENCIPVPRGRNQCSSTQRENSVPVLRVRTVFQYPEEEIGVPVPRGRNQCCSTQRENSVPVPRGRTVFQDPEGEQCSSTQREKSSHRQLHLAEPPPCVTATSFRATSLQLADPAKKQVKICL